MNYNFYIFGPFVFKTKIDKEDIKKIKDLCIKDKSKDARKSLAASIDNEYFINNNKFADIIKEYFKLYAEGHKKFYDEEIKNFNCKTAWVNYMKNGDYNPVHIHSHCHLSSVLYLKVPKKLKEEHNKYLGTIKNSGPGCISFLYGENKPFAITNYNIFPEEGDFFIFPYNLAHYVFPFKSKVERISVAANFDLEILQK